MLLEIGIPTIIMLNILLRVILHHGTEELSLLETSQLEPNQLDPSQSEPTQG